MKAFTAVVCVMLLSATHSLAQGRWAVDGHAGVSAGNQTGASFSWWGDVHRALTPAVAIGLEAGSHSWDGRSEDRIVVAADMPFAGITSAPYRLEHISASLRATGPALARGSAPYLQYGLGAYRQRIIGDSNDSRDGRVCLGASMALGAAGTNGIKPGAELRFDIVDTQPGPSAYISAALGLHLHR